MASLSAEQLTLAPLGAGDLIDRAVRLYRRHLFTLIRIAAPPVLITALGSISWTISSRQLFSTTQTSALPFYIFLLIVAAGLIFGGHIFSLLVMGGAARNLVMHLLWNEPVSARATYAAVRSRFWSLLGAMIIVVLWGSLSLIVCFGGWYMLVLVAAMGAVLLAAIAPVWLPIITGTLAALMATALAVWLFFFMFGRVAYVPQALLVEGKGVFQSVGRSFALASGNIRRLMAVSLFTYFATWSALMILVIPLGWYGYLNGIDPSPWNASNWPAWYAIGYSVLEPLSSILLAPIWMLGLSLLYVDERVRHEGYDIELLASRHLDKLPQLDVSSPLGPAISIPEPPAVTARRSVLGLS